MGAESFCRRFIRFDDPVIELDSGVIELYGALLMPVDASVSVGLCDLLFIDLDDVKPASMLADQGTLNANQQLFHDVFGGVALSAKPAGVAGEVWMATQGLFEYPCPSDQHLTMTHHAGAIENSAGTLLENRRVVVVSNRNASVGYVARMDVEQSTRMLVYIVSSIAGGLQNPL